MGAHLESACNQVAPDDAERFEARGIARLKEMGLRVTRPRRLVISALATTRRPLGAYQIREKVVEAGGRIDVVSVYRILAGLREAGLVHRVWASEGYVACSAKHGGAHQTLHLVCSRCGCVEEVPIPHATLTELRVAGARLGFLAEDVSVEVTGVCEHCR